MSDLKGKWALILGASSGFGEAVALRLSELGMNIIGVHMDRKSTLPHAEQVAEKIRAHGSKAAFFNVNAADPAKRGAVLDEARDLTEGRVHCLLHSLAFGSLKPFLPGADEQAVSPEQLHMTLNIMANSLVFWTQDLFERGMLPNGARILAMTSSGSHRVFPYYGPVSAAKAALESHCRQLAMELAPHGVTVNAICAGVTETPALKKIPGNEKMVEWALAKNPSGRLTRPEDVADFVPCLLGEGARWLTGNVLGVDGGENIVG